MRVFSCQDEVSACNIRSEAKIRKRNKKCTYMFYLGLFLPVAVARLWLLGFGKIY